MNPTALAEVLQRVPTDMLDAELTRRRHLTPAVHAALAAVAEEFNIPISSILGKADTTVTVRRARHMATVIVYRHKNNLTQSARVLNRQSHSSIYHSLRTHAKLLAYPDYQARFHRVLAQIKSTQPAP
jgi:chromosomal replication initiation ATPase DnaA